jgi:putative ABC transport system substrate-binding protein
MRRKGLIWIALLGLVFCTTAQAQARLLLLVSHETPLYQSFQQGFKTSLDSLEKDPKVESMLADNYRPEQQELEPGSVVVIAGVEAAKKIPPSEFEGVRVIYTMLPLSSYHWLRENHMLAQDHTVVLIDQPAYRFIHLARVVFPDIESLGYLYGDASAEYVPQLAKAATGHKIDFHAIALNRDRRLTSMLREAYSTNDVVLVLPDPYLFNRRVLQGLLLASLRAKKPLIGYSESYINAGALLALYSTPEQLGRQSAEVAVCYLQDCPDDTVVVRYARYFSVGVNKVIARQMRISLPDPDDIQARIKALESDQPP